MADALSTAAMVSAGMNEEYKAAELYGRSALIRTKAFGAEHPAVANDLEATGLALCRAGEYGEAVQPLLMALRSQRDYLVEQVARRANGGDGLRLAATTFYRTELFHSLCALSFSNAATSLPAKGAEQLGSCKALLEEVQASQASLETDSRTSTRELREKLDAIQSQLARLPENNLDSALRDARRRQLLSAKTQIEETLAGWNGLVARTIRERNLTLADIARSLPLQSVLVDFIQYRRYDFAAKTNRWKEQRYAAYLTFPLAHDSTNVMVERVDLSEAPPINEALELVCKRMSSGQFAAKDFSPAMQRLSDLVYAPLAGHLTNVSHLIVCPDGQLSRLPFEMLPVGNKFLIEEKVISYVTSGREVVRLRGNQSNSKQKIQNSKSLVMGNPDFDLDLTALSSRGNEGLKSNLQPAIISSEPGNQSLLASAATRSLSRSYRGMTFTPLPGSGMEARDVAKLLGDDAILRLGADAREAELKAVVSPRVLHLATHGFFLPDQEFKHTNSLAWSSAFTRLGPPKGGTPNDWENPLVRCGIALAGANHALQITNAIAEDGLFTGLEASLLNLQGTELVILSACDSGTGEVKIGEGVMSLRRAFRIAGAESVLASHWPVSDKATSRLMTEFMQRWRSGEPRAQAWREAQLVLLRSKGAKEDFSNPFFWSTFTLTGQWN
jgi:CHAT domain-containing protein